MSDAARTKNTVFVSGLDTAVDESTLHLAFLPFGDIIDIKIPRHNPDDPTSLINPDGTPINNNNNNNNNNAPDAHRGFGYVEFETPEDALAAIDNMDQAELYGRVIKVSQAKPTREKGEGLGSKLAVWEQEGWLAKHEVSEEDKAAAGAGARSTDAVVAATMDPMQGLEGLDIAGPKPQ